MEKNYKAEIVETHLPPLSLQHLNLILAQRMAQHQQPTANNHLDFHTSGPLQLTEADFIEGHYRLGKVYFDKADLPVAKKHFEWALRLMKQLGPNKEWDLLEIKVLGFLIRIASEQFEYESAKKWIESAEILLERNKTFEFFTPAELYYDYSMLEIYKKNPRAALEYSDKALQEAQLAASLAAEASASQLAEATSVGGLAASTSHASRLQQSDQYHADFDDQEDHALFNEILVKAHYTKASAYFFLKDYAMALSELELLEKALKETKKLYLFGAMYLLKGNCFTDLGDYTLALENYTMAKKVLRKRKCWNLNLYIMLGEAIIAKRKGEYDKALNIFDFLQCLVDTKVYTRLCDIVFKEVAEIKDSSVDLYLDKKSRLIYEKNLGRIDFKHRFVLMEILFLLAKSPGIYFDKEQLAKQIWGDEYNPLIHDKLIYTSISRLRKLIEPSENGQKYIVRGKEGYALNDSVKIRFCREQDLDSFAIGNIEINSPV